METVSRRVAEVVERLGYECVHVGLRTDSSGLRLQVLIDSLGGIGTEDCERVSRAVDRMLDEEEVPGLAGRYYLEVSSPGLERPLFTLEHYVRFLGREARLRLSEPVEGRRSLTGTIEAAGEGRVVLRVEDEEREITVPFKAIKGGNLVFRFEPAPAKGRAKGKPHPAKNAKHHEEEL